MKRLDFVVIGRERRMACLAAALSEQGFLVEYLAEGWRDAGNAGIPQGQEEEACRLLRDARGIVGGIPFLEKEAALALLQPGQLFFGGMLDGDFVGKCRERGIACVDFMEDETAAVYNATATAEGTIAEAIRGKETNLHGSECLVLGYGRCGKVLCDKLKGLSARVTAASREETELAWARTFGFDVMELSALPGQIQKYEYIFNTIPKVLLDRSLLAQTREDVLIVDIASGEGGVDYKAAGELGRRALHALGLPGKYAPMASARYLAAYAAKRMRQAQSPGENSLCTAYSGDGKLTGVLTGKVGKL